jgi:hypothetical protein
MKDLCHWCHKPHRDCICGPHTRLGKLYYRLRVVHGLSLADIARVQRDDFSRIEWALDKHDTIKDAAEYVVGG